MAFSTVLHALWFALYCLTAFVSPVPSGMQADKALAECLLNTDPNMGFAYSKSYRPVEARNTITTVEVFPTIYGIVEVDDYKESMTLLIWTGMRWKDEYLAWQGRTGGCLDDISGAQDTGYLYIPLSMIWQPDVTPVNILSKTDLIDPASVLALVKQDGTVYAEFNQAITFLCNFDMSSFPFDEQNCTLTFASWSRDASQLRVRSAITTSQVTNMTASGIILMTHAQWDVTAITSATDDAVDSPLDMPNGAKMDKFSELDFTLTLKRKPDFYVYAVIAPIFLITSVHLIGLFTPSSSGRDRGEKATLGMTTLLALVVMLVIVLNYLPYTSSGLPLLGNYVLFELLIAGLAIIVTVIIMFCDHQISLFSHSPPPVWLQMITGVHDNDDDNNDNDKEKRSGKVSDASTITNVTNMDGSEMMEKSPMLQLQKSSPKIQLIANMVHHGRKMEARKAEKATQLRIAQQWTHILGVVDVVAMVVIFALNVIGIVIIFLMNN